jgi:uncharacterized membrane protein YfcA
VTPVEIVLLALAGLGAGLAGSMAGLASLISYPALLAAGLPALTANVTNTVALVFSGVGSAWGSRPELEGQGLRVGRLGVTAVAGGIVGGVLLLRTPPGDFELIVPWLIGLAAAVIIVQPRPRFLRQLHTGGDAPALFVGVFLVAIYGGYFGAAAGVMLFALLLAATGDSYARSNAIKNVVLALANGVAALAFALFAAVQWAAVAPLAAGFLVGGRVGPVVVRHAPVRVLRYAIGVAGLGLAVKLGLDAYR